MTVIAKTLVKNKFWIIKQDGQKLGTLQKKDDNGWIFLSKKDHRQVFYTQESLFTKFGFNIFEEKREESIVKQTDNFEVHGYSCSQHPYNQLFDVQKQLPVYTKTPKSKSQFCAGYYIICFTAYRATVPGPQFFNHGSGIFSCEFFQAASKNKCFPCIY